MTSLAELINDALPQTQCTRCGYPDCASYAKAIADNQADINQCPPGGEEGIVRLSKITGFEIKPLNPENGFEAPRLMAVIDEAWCIGCTLCIKACPTDAIVGSNKFMHTVIEPYCTGCELCVPVCPVDCISLEEVTTTTGWDAWSGAQTATARARYESRQIRLVKEENEHADRMENKAIEKLSNLAAHTHDAEGPELDRKRSIIEAALARAREKRGV